MTLLSYRHIFHHVKGQLLRHNIVQSESFDFDDLFSVGCAIGIVLGSVGDVLFNVTSLKFVCHSANKLAQGRIVHAIYVPVYYRIGVAVESARPQLLQVTEKLQSSVSGNVRCNHNVRVHCWRLKLFALFVRDVQTILVDWLHVWHVDSHRRTSNEKKSPRFCTSVDVKHLHAESTEESVVKYVDVQSLYPYVCKNKHYPVGHPRCLVGPALQKYGRDITNFFLCFF